MKTLILSAAASLLALTHIFAQGNLIPPGPPAPMMKTLDQIEPRVDVATLPGDATNQFIISAPGSYYLSRNIAGVSGLNGVSIQASDVTLDLNGFALVGVAGSLGGVAVSGARTSCAIRNGSVRGWGGDGVSAAGASTSVFERLRVSVNGSIGLRAGINGVITGCVAAGNAVHGIAAGDGCVIIGCTATGNGTGQANTSFGIYAGAGNTVSDCTASYNTAGGGIYAVENSTVVRCSAVGNTNTAQTLGTGIEVGSGCTVSASTAGNNFRGIETGFGCTVSGCTVRANKNIGIVVYNASHVTGNTIDASGLNLNIRGTGSRIDSNLVTAASGDGIADTGGGNLIIRNSCRANAVNFSISAGSTVGPIIGPGNPITTTNPWANFGF